MERTSPGQSLATHPFRKAETTNLVLQATEAYQNSFLGRSKTPQTLAGILNGKADSDIAGATESGGVLTPGTGTVTLWKFNTDSGGYEATTITLPAGLAHNLSPQSVTAGRMLVLIPRDGYWQIIFEGCPP
jgi:hypothetical protein